jgi:hypothetical protein
MQKLIITDDKYEKSLAMLAYECIGLKVSESNKRIQVEIPENVRLNNDLIEKFCFNVLKDNLKNTKQHCAEIMEKIDAIIDHLPCSRMQLLDKLLYRLTCLGGERLKGVTIVSTLGAATADYGENFLYSTVKIAYENERKEESASESAAMTCSSSSNTSSTSSTDLKATNKEKKSDVKQKAAKLSDAPRCLFNGNGFNHDDDSSDDSDDDNDDTNSQSKVAAPSISLTSSKTN